MLPEIGSNFWELSSTRPISINQFFWSCSYYHYNVLYFKSGRNAIKGLCRVLKEPRKVLLPAFTCDTVIQPFVDEGWEVLFYRLNADLSIDTENLLALCERECPTALLCHSYYGFNTLQNAENLIGHLHDHGMIIIEDITQSLLSGYHLDCADYYVSSIRKFFAIPEGGVLISKKQLDIAGVEKADPAIIEKARAVYEQKRQYIYGERADKEKSFRNGYIELAEWVSQNDRLCHMCDETKAIFYCQDYDIIKQARRTNYSDLVGLIKESREVRPIFTELSDRDIPLYLPVEVLGDRKKLQSFMAKNNVFCPVIWSRPEIVCETDAVSCFAYDKLLCIPIDQRYGSDEMHYIAQLIAAYEKVL